MENNLEEFVAKCPHCGHTLSVTDQYDTDYGDDYIIDYYCGYCPECDYSYEWNIHYSITPTALYITDEAAPEKEEEEE